MALTASAQQTAPPQSGGSAVVLLQMGGPATLADVEPFLFNVFDDPDIIQWPRAMKPFQSRLARRIARRRTPKVQERYDLIGGGSPLGAITQAQARALAANLSGADAPPLGVHVAMRYTNPNADDVVTTLVEQGATDITLLPLYPHWTRGTTGSSVKDFVRAARASGFTGAVHAIERWGDHPAYVDLLCAQLADEVAAVRSAGDDGPVHALMSAHGLPVSYVKSGDPYPQQVEGTAQAVGAAALASGFAEWHLGYQSKVGPVEWLRPYTDDVLPAVAEAGAETVVAVPLGFVSDHIETLFDLDITCREQAEALGLKYRRVPSFNDDPRFAAVLRRVLAECPVVEVDV